MKMIILLLLIVPTFLGCNYLDPSPTVDSTYSKVHVPYDLLQPSNTYVLPDELEEISGLAWINDVLLTVNDEEGKIFSLNSSGEIIDIYDFGKDGDYEGIAASNEEVYVIESNGDIYRTGPDTAEFKTSLKSANNVEGLAFDQNNDRLLLALKGNAGMEKDLTGRAIYGFDLEGGQLLEEPLRVIQGRELNDKITERGLDYTFSDFGPSGVAIHPQSGNIFIISHQGRSMVVLGQDFKILEVVLLEHQIFKQPEGICFSPDGVLYIANEGRGGSARIHVFHQK